MNPPVIMVGVDGSPASREALRWGLLEAVRRASTVEAVLVTPPDDVFVPATSLGVHPHGEKPQLHPAEELHALVSMVRAEIADAPEVVETVVKGSAPDQLARASRNAEVLVVGRRGRRPLTEVFLGSVAASCLRHAECPVVVIPPAVSTEERNSS